MAKQKSDDTRGIPGGSKGDNRSAGDPDGNKGSGNQGGSNRGGNNTVAGNPGVGHDQPPRNNKRGVGTRTDVVPGADTPKP